MKRYKPLPQCVNIEEYDPNTFDYVPKSLDALVLPNVEHFPFLEDWIKIFYDSISSFEKVAANDECVDDAARKANHFATSYRSKLDNLFERARLRGNPNNSIANCLTLCSLREEALRCAGFRDCFHSIKNAENTKALWVLPAVLEELDAIEEGAERWKMLLRGICAANIFDLGAKYTTNMYEKVGGVDFHNTRDQGLLSRPWVIDDLDKVVQRLTADIKHRKVSIVS